MSVRAEFSELIGKVLDRVEVDRSGNEIHFYTSAGRFTLFHEQDCCESVYIEDVTGDLEALAGTLITDAREDTNRDLPSKNEFANSYRWTFYNLTTLGGSATFRWYGTSNGYYSERVNFIREESSRPRICWLVTGREVEKAAAEPNRELWKVFRKDESGKCWHHASNCELGRDIFWTAEEAYTHAIDHWKGRADACRAQQREFEAAYAAYQAKEA